MPHPRFSFSCALCFTRPEPPFDRACLAKADRPPQLPRPELTVPPAPLREVRPPRRPRARPPADGRSGRCRFLRPQPAVGEARLGSASPEGPPSPAPPALRPPVWVQVRLGACASVLLLGPVSRFSLIVKYIFTFQPSNLINDLYEDRELKSFREVYMCVPESSLTSCLTDALQQTSRGLGGRSAGGRLTT